MNNNWVLILATLFTALVLTVLPMPDWTIWLRPAWVLLVLIFWTIHSPYKVSVGMAWLIGLMVDLLTGTLLGEHALAYTLVIYFVAKGHIRLKMSPVAQQCFTVLMFVFIYQVVIFCIQGFVGQLPESYLYWLSTLTSVILWPWLYVLMRDLCRRFKIA